MASVAAGEESALEDALRREWYHCIELAPGVVTPGWYDPRPIVDRLPIPGSLAGARCLDVGTFDGFWAFEMERRGAAEVVAVDVLTPEAWDWPAGSSPETIGALARRQEGGRGFEIAREALGSGVVRHDLSVYELAREEIGEFDFVYLGSLLIHLRDPIRALERVRSVCRGRLLVVDAIDWWLTLRMPRTAAARLDGMGRPWWWKPNRAGLARMLHASGFRLVQRPQVIYMPPGPGFPRARPSLRTLRSQEGRGLLLARLKGDPHVALLAEPAPA